MKFLTFLLSIGSGALFAQASSVETFAAKRDVEQSNFIVRTFDERYEGVRGQTMVRPGFMKGTITLLSGKQVPVANMNLDALKNEVVLLRDSSEVTFLSSLIKDFTIYSGVDTLRFIKIRTASSPHDFFQRITEGEISLLKKHVREVLEPDYKGAYSSNRTFTEIRSEDRYYVLKAGKNELFKNKKMLLSILPEKKTVIESYLKTNKVSFKSDEDLRRLFVHLNSN